MPRRRAGMHVMRMHWRLSSILTRSGPGRRNQRLTIQCSGFMPPGRYDREGEGWSSCMRSAQTNDRSRVGPGGNSLRMRRRWVDCQSGPTLGGPCNDAQHRPRPPKLGARWQRREMIENWDDFAKRLLRTRSAEAERAFRSSVRPVYRNSDAKSRPEHVGSCILLNVDGQPILSTAAHILDNLREGYWRCWGNALGTDSRWRAWGNSQARR